MGGIKVESCKVLPDGFEHDRRWMLVDETGKFMSQREDAKMALFNCQIENENLIVSYQDDKLEIPLAADSEIIKRVSVWSSKLKAPELSPSISQWFSERLDKKCHFVKKTSISKRSKRLFVPPFKSTVSFADGYPYLILGTASMDELNNRLDKELHIDRFRANIIVTTNEAHEEDEWKGKIKIGSATLQGIKPCARCQVITIDQNTGEKGKEPLKTLATYRKKRNKIYFGQNAIAINEGLIKVGDSLIINE